MKKKMIILLASAVALAVMAGCGNKNASGASSAPAETEGGAGPAGEAAGGADETSAENNRTDAGTGKPGETETELVIAGGDGAGLAAAIMAVSEGLDPSSILIVEAGEELASDVPGKEALFNVAEPAEQPDIEIEDYFENFLADTRKAGQETNDTVMVEHMVEKASEARDWLEDLGVGFGDMEQGEGSSVARSYSGAGDDLSSETAEKLSEKVEELKIPVRYGVTVKKINYGGANEVSGIVIDGGGTEETIKCLAVIVTDPKLLPLFDEVKTAGSEEGKARGLLVTACAEVQARDGEEKVIPGLYAAGGMIEAGVHGSQALEGNELVAMTVFGMTAGTEAAIYIGDNRE